MNLCSILLEAKVARHDVRMLSPLKLKALRDSITQQIVQRGFGQFLLRDGVLEFHFYSGRISNADADAIVNDLRSQFGF